MTTDPSVAAQIRDLAVYSPMSAGTRKKLHALAVKVELIERDRDSLLKTFGITPQQAAEKIQRLRDGES